MLLFHKMSDFYFVTGRNQMIPINFSMHFSYLKWRVFVSFKLKISVLSGV